MTASQIASSSLNALTQQTRIAAMNLAVLSTTQRNEAIEALAQALESSRDDILQANIRDCEGAIADGIAKPLYKRLHLDEHKLRDAIAGVRDVGKLADPIGAIQIHRELDAGLVLKRITCNL